MNKIPAKYKRMVWVGFFMAGAISFSQVYRHPSSSVFDIITMPPAIGLLGAALGSVVAFLVWAGERLFARTSGFRAKTLQK